MGNLPGKSPLGRSRRKYEDKIKMGLTQRDCEGEWKCLWG
jgi:hypothetical protein